LELLGSDFRQQLPVTAAFIVGVVAYAFWKKVRGRSTEYIGTLIGGAFMLYLDAIHWLGLYVSTRFGARGTFGLLAAFVVIGFVADMVCNRLYLKALALAEPPVASI
jgi:hypothetical protein